VSSALAVGGKRRSWQISHSDSAARYPAASGRRLWVTELVERVRRADTFAIARLISLIENDSHRLREVARALAPYTGYAQVVGLTGSPGVGKSTLTSAPAVGLCAQGRRVGVLAVDPSSPFSGGALLGDRIHMQDAAGVGVFIRSMASRGQLGGLSAAVPQALRVLDAARFDVVLVETVGAGQAEVQIASLADVCVLVLAPGFGDGVQAGKAGIVEIADVLVVNKADLAGADETVRDLRGMLALGGRHSAPGAWRPPIVATVGQRGDGIADLLGALALHRGWLERGEELAEVTAIALGCVRTRLAGLYGSGALAAAADRVATGELDPYGAADELLIALGAVT
jgi:LAO/AO transport system kinase